SVDEPGRIEMAQGVEAGVLRFAIILDDSSADLCRLVEALDDMHVVPQFAFAVWEDQRASTPSTCSPRADLSESYDCRPRFSSRRLSRTCQRAGGHGSRFY